MGKPDGNAEIVQDALRRFPALGLLTISRYILNTHGGAFDNNLERIRNRVRYYSGSMGENNRKNMGNTDLIRPQGHVVKLPQSWRQVRTPYALKPKLWGILSDIHIPFHEEKPLEAAVKFLQAEGVEGIFINGDLMEAQAVSYWPSAHRDFNGELEAVTDFLDWLRQEFPKAEIVWKPGNHEYRLPRLFIEKVPELAETPFLAIEAVLGLEARGIEFLDYFQIVQAGKLPIIHGHEVKHIDRSVNPARGLFLKIKTFGACSHCHSTSMHTPKTIHGDLLTTHSFGCLCQLQPDYNPYGNDWNWGMAIINVEKNGQFEIVNKRITQTGKIV